MAAIHTRVLIDASDFVGLRIRCAECGHDHLHPLDVDVSLPARCIRCNRTFWPSADLETPERELIQRLQQIVTRDHDCRARLVFEIDASGLDD